MTKSEIDANIPHDVEILLISRKVYKHTKAINMLWVTYNKYVKHGYYIGIHKYIQ